MDNYQKIYQTTTEMMMDRKLIIEREYPQQSEEDVFSPMMIAGNEENKIIVYITYKKMGKKEVLKFLENVQESSYNHAILITQHVLTSQAKKSLNVFEDVYIEVFLHKEVLFNITKHCLQPKFSLMNVSEIKTLCENLQCSLSDMPKLSINDPIARYYNARTKNVFKILRRENIIFRVVI
jgi:DNA-directed RNA polymerase I, II, and III subunit RPABC1